MKILKNHLTQNDCYKSGKSISPIGIQIHSIGTGQNNAASLISYWNQPGIDCCVHYLCDARAEGLVYQILPEDCRSWADAGFGNNNLITIEMMESSSIRYTSGASYVVLDADKFKADIRRSYDTCVQLCASICRRREWNPLAKLSNGLYLISSHNEGRLEGVSSSHVDPTHIWNRFGLSMDGFRRDVAAQLNEAPGADRIWLGWTKRESGSAGFRCVNGDSGHAQGKYQFDCRYALVPFMQFCIDRFPGHYAGFQKYIGCGPGSPELVSNAPLASLWLSYCDKYPTEFEALQDTFAYQNYYLEIKKYLQNLYAIHLDRHSPAVKGTAFSMSIRSGALAGARKFEGCRDQSSEEEILSIAYRAYGSSDAGRWTKSAQYGDALKALAANEYSEIRIDPGVSGNAASDSGYASSLKDYPSGQKYRLTTDNYIRTSPGGGYVPFRALSESAKKKSLKCSDGKCKLKKGTVITALESGKLDGNIWMRIKNGWIAANVKGRPRVKRVEKKGLNVPYTVKVTSDVLYIRTGPGTQYPASGYTGAGTFTIVREETSGGHTWGLLKSYQTKSNGWIAVDLGCVTRQ